MIDITQGDARDVAAIMPVMDDAFDPLFGESWSSSQCLAALSMPNCRLILARNNSAMIGFAISRWVLDDEELLMIAVSQHHQRQGVASRLLGEIADNAGLSGRRSLFLEVRSGNTARAFYENSGFTETGCRKDYYKGSDGILHDSITITLNM